VLEHQGALDALRAAWRIENGSIVQARRMAGKIAPQRRLIALACTMVVVLLINGCATARHDVPRPRSEAWPAPAQTALGRAAQSPLAGASGSSAFHVVHSGLEALGLRAGLADAAQHTLDLQYYTMHEDATTQLLIHRVLVAARRGVRVRLLIDDLYAVGRDLELAALSATPGIEVRVFNPFLWRGAFGLSRLFELAGDLERLNRRMHNKLWIADNAAAIIGGRNLGDVYFDAGTDVNFSDMDVLAAGAVVRDLSRSFDAYWNDPMSVPIQAFVSADPGPATAVAFERKLERNLQAFQDGAYARALRDSDLGARLLAGALPLVAAPAQAIYDLPAPPPARGSSPTPGVFPPRIRELIESARIEIVLVSPYFIPSESGIEALGAAMRRGVRVRLLTNSLASTDVPVVHAGYANIRSRLLAEGVEVHEMRPTAMAGQPPAWRITGSSSASLHAKAIIVDRQRVLVGSMNLDPRSRQGNTEVAVQIESVELGEQIARLFDTAMIPARAFRVRLAAHPASAGALTWDAEDDGRAVQYDAEPASLWRRILARVLGWLVPEYLL